MTTGTSVVPLVPCVLAGMQRGSSDLSHQSGGPTGSSSELTLSEHPSCESASHAQSAASAEAASSNDKAATASTRKNDLMNGELKVYRARRVPQQLRERGVKPTVQDVG